MEEGLQLINQERISHGYTIHHFRTYNKHCNRMKREYFRQNHDLYLIYSLESNLAKFKMLNSITFLYKNKRLLKKSDASKSDFSRIYLRYVLCFIENEKNSLSIDDLVSLRHELADYYSFLDDIYRMNDNRHDFEQYKIKYKWHDVSLLFETQKILDSFLNNSFFLNDFRFNTQLALKILDVENKKMDLFDFVKTENDPFHVFDRVNILFSRVCELERFLNENFVESEYVQQLKNSSEKVLGFVKKVMEYNSGVLHSDIDSFTVPAHFELISDHLESMKKNKKVNPSKLRSVLLGILEKRLAVDVTERSMPFLPVFYDIANDFITYSSVDNSIAGLLQDFNFLRRK
ncbi:uncharacterized protein VICG_00594 [Vittaforma corneae ATCC 50505]|uniref:Uncharacterized protein n=1 Tax=Vittaforma corneae (strain ATCC 50505) TaxID=993615 RepID=L2GPR1_VITCO|nr:uncharacterized protein VICG_00594 [Vittaforma corneae ATCC 50505]ELA42495.1 hypothetical protein VICG_00594 [Vittaforma corneae ATCC 50505]